jgi:hypothetical protein
MAGPVTRGQQITVRPLSIALFELEQSGENGIIN